MRRPKKLRRPQRDTRPRPLSLLRDADDDTRPIPRQDRYVTAPVGPAPPRRIGDWVNRGWAGAVNDRPASAAEHMDDRCRKAHLSLQLAAEDLDAQGMLYRVDDAARLLERGEELDERSVIAGIVAKATRHLMGPREPWQPGPWPQPEPQPQQQEPVRWWVPEDPSGVRAAYDRAFNGNGAA